MTSKAQDFYDREYLQEIYSNISDANSHPFYPVLREFIDKYKLHDKKCLEVGCGRGAFQDMVPDYTGVDISRSAGKHLHKYFAQTSAIKLPFKDCSFDAIWSYAVLEHVSEPELALDEMIRVLRPEGVLLLNPAWRVPPWRSKGYEVKKYGDQRLVEKGVKIIVTMLNYIWMRGIFRIPFRLFREIRWALQRQPIRLSYITFKPNYEEFLLPDSDACTSLDNHEVTIWFLSRGLHIPDTQSLLHRIIIRCRPVIVIKPSIYS